MDDVKQQMLKISSEKLIVYLLSEIDDLEPKYEYYDYYFEDLTANRVSNVYEDTRKGLENELYYLDKEELVEYMIKHIFIYE